MSAKLKTREKLKEEVMEYFETLIDKYSFSAERGVDEMQKEIDILEYSFADTTKSIEERVMELMCSNVVLAKYIDILRSDLK